MTYTYIYQASEKENASTLLLLHGTGGSEHDLIRLGHFVDQDANILSIRGNEPENGLNRFFKRLAEGVFDIGNLKMRTKELYDFLDSIAKKEDFSRDKIIALGYSNGANIAASLLFSYNNPLMGALLLHPMVPFRDEELAELTNTPVFIGAGTNDPICAPAESEELKQLLTDAGSDVSIYWGDNGHSLSQEELFNAASWYKKLIKN